MPVAITLHVISAIVWVGGMFFAYVCLRPAVAGLKNPGERLALLCRTMGRFFNWVWVAVILLPLTGFWMAASMHGDYSLWPLYVKLMMLLGVLMIMLYLHVYFAPFRRLKKALADADLAEAGRQLDKIRLIIGVNLAFGILVSVIASGGRYL